jgi:hypothetical protein
MSAIALDRIFSSVTKAILNVPAQATDRLLTAFSAEPLVGMDLQSNQFLSATPRHLPFGGYLR